MWKGLKYYAKAFWSGAGGTPTVTYPDSGTTTRPGNLQDYWKWFREDELVRRCITINAYFSTLSAGFETELKPTVQLPEEEETALLEKYSYVKDMVDKVNQQVNLDRVLFASQVKRAIYGRAGWEIVYGKSGLPSWLLSLKSERLEPVIDRKTWALKEFKYSGNTQPFDPNKVLYFTNLQLENDYVGLSDIEPVTPICQGRSHLLRRDFPEIAHRLWAPYTLLQADDSQIPTEAKRRQFMQDLLDAAKAGKSCAFNKAVTAQVVNQTIDMAGLVRMLEKFDESVMRQFGTPRFLLGVPLVNRATSYAEMEAYVEGTVRGIQRYFKRELEEQWYGPMVKAILKANGADYNNPPVELQHKWQTIRTTDIFEMARAVAGLYANGLGILAGYEDVAFDMLGLHEAKERWQEEQAERAMNETTEPEHTN